jgi:hypothetical protein
MAPPLQRKNGHSGISKGITSCLLLLATSFSWWSANQNASGFSHPFERGANG